MGREREREPLEVLKLLPLFLFLSSSFLSILMGASPPLILLLPPSFSKAPLVHTLHLPPPSSSFSSSSCLSLRPSACLPSLHPGGLGQCWRHSRDLQEICLSEKQLVRLSTANVCTLGPPLLLGTARARPS